MGMEEGEFKDRKKMQIGGKTDTQSGLQAGFTGQKKSAVEYGQTHD